MAIRFQNDAAAVVIPPNQSSRKYGQQLVQQRQKYDDEQRQGMRDNLYDRQKQNMQNAAQLGMQNLQGQQAMDRLLAAQKAAREQRIEQGQARIQQSKDATQSMLRRQRRADIQKGIDNGEFEPEDANALIKINADEDELEEDIISNGVDALQAAQWRADLKARRDVYAARRKPIKTPEQAHNDNIRWLDKRTKKIIIPTLAQLEAGPPEGVVFYDPTTKKTEEPFRPQAPQAPQQEYKMSDKEYWLATPERKEQIAKSLAAVKKGLQDQIETGDFKLPEGVTLTDAAWAQIQAGYREQEQWEQGGKAAPMQAPPATGQPMAPTGQLAPPAASQPVPQPAVQPAVQPVTPAMGQPSAGGVPPVAGQLETLPPQAGQQSQGNLNRDINALRGMSDFASASVSPDIKDADSVELKEQPAGTIIKKKDGSLYAKNSKGRWDKLNDAQATGMQTPSAQAPSMPDIQTPDVNKATNELIPKDIIDSMRVPDSAMQMPDDAEQQQAIPALTEKIIEDELYNKSQPAAAESAARLEIDKPAADMIGEAIKTFESGTPEQKAILRQKMKSSDNANNLVAQAKAGNADAEKAIALLEAELSPTDIVADEIIAAKKDGKGAVDRLNSLKASGKLDDASYTSAIVANSGKSAKDFYIKILNQTGKSYDNRSQEGRQIKREANVLNAIWTDMGMYAPESYVRAFQKQPTREEVIRHVAMKDKIPFKDAEEWLYRQILEKEYAAYAQRDFEESLAKDGDANRDKKIDEKRDAWTSKTK